MKQALRVLHQLNISFQDEFPERTVHYIIDMRTKVYNKPPDYIKEIDSFKAFKKN
jgi:hypothetical protein